MHLVVDETRDVLHAVLEAAVLAFPAQRLDRAGADHSHVHTLEEENVADVLHRAGAEDRQHAHVVAVVDDRRDVGGVAQIGAGDIAGDDRHRVGVDLLAHRLDRGVAARRARARRALLRQRGLIGHE